MASWRAKPAAITVSGSFYRQVAPGFPPLYHNAGVYLPDQETGRWHIKGEGFAQYLSDSALGAWAEFARAMNIRSTELAREVRRDLWQVAIHETAVADLSTPEKYQACGLDPKLALDPDYGRCHQLGLDLREAGYRGVLSPSAALADTINLTLFGERYEEVVPALRPGAGRPDSLLLRCAPLAERAPLPEVLCAKTRFR